MKTYTEEEQALAKQEAKSTYAQGGFVRSAALSLLLLQLSSAYFNLARPSDSDALQPSLRHVDSTRESTQVSIRIGAAEIFSELNRVYDSLMRHSKDLDEDSHKLLYSNLWKLYD